MADPTANAVATVADRKSHRPLKRARQTIAEQQHDAVATLFQKQPDIQVSGAKRTRTAADLAAPPEYLTHVQGSSAGAGSGEFHVYKAARRREHERIRMMEDEARNEEADKEWAERRAEVQAKDESKLSKNQKRRQKAKANKAAAKSGAMDVDGDQGSGARSGKLKPLAVTRRADDDDEDAGESMEETTAAVPKHVSDEAPAQVGITIHDDD